MKAITNKICRVPTTLSLLEVSLPPLLGYPHKLFSCSKFGLKLNGYIGILLILPIQTYPNTVLVVLWNRVSVIILPYFCFQYALLTKIVCDFLDWFPSFDLLYHALTEEKKIQLFCTSCVIFYCPYHFDTIAFLGFNQGIVG